MPPREKLLRPLAWIFVTILAAACAGTLAQQDPVPGSAPSEQVRYPDQQVVGEEEVLYGAEEDEFGKPVPGPAGKAGEFLVAVSYVGVIVASFLLPLLAI